MGEDTAPPQQVFTRPIQPGSELPFIEYSHPNSGEHYENEVLNSQLISIFSVEFAQLRWIKNENKPPKI
jgi:hypothetical protein